MNCDKTTCWKDDYLKSIDFYNEWFLHFAPSAFRAQRALKEKDVRRAFQLTKNLTNINTGILRQHPAILPVLRMALAPPIARDRLVGLSYVSKTLVSAMEGSEMEPSRIPPRLPEEILIEQLQQIVDVLVEMLDYDLFPWLEKGNKRKPVRKDLARGIAVIADRLCGAMTDPIIRNAQERRQLDTLSSFLVALGYREIKPNSFDDLFAMPKGCYAFRHTVIVHRGKQSVNIPIDCIISRHDRGDSELPILIEAKSAGDATNTNKHRKEEAQKYTQLKQTFGGKIKFILLLCGYFDPGYQGYEAAEGIDWVWEHRLSDLLTLHLEKGEPKTYVARESAVDYCTSSVHTEQNRLSDQQDVDASKSAFERNRLGQYSTPFSLAHQMIQYSLPLVTHDQCPMLQFLEPACGSGVFISALRQEYIPHVFVTGIEIDTMYSNIAKKYFEGDGIRIVTDNFFAFAQKSQQELRFDWLVTNPPYVRHHHVGLQEKTVLQQRVVHTLGIQVSGLAGLYIYYILLADALLKENAIASWLIPSEFLYTNYGQALREYLSTHVTLIRIHKFDSEDVQFDDALVSSCIVTYRKSKPLKSHTFDVTTGRYATPRIISRQASALWQGQKKWIFFDSSAGKSATMTGPTVGDLFHVTRGIATGNNAYFTLTPEKVEQLQLEHDVLVPLLPSPRYVQDSIIHGNRQGFPTVEKSRYLFSVLDTYEVIEKSHPHAYRYLQEGESKGIHRGALCKGRKRWYLQEKRMPPLYVASYMGRISERHKTNAIRFYLNRTNAIVTNGFICLYPKPFLARLLEGDFVKQEELLEVLNTIGVEDIVCKGRSYGGGLLKIEPKELSCIRLPCSPRWLSWDGGNIQTELFSAYDMSKGNEA